MTPHFLLLLLLLSFSSPSSSDPIPTDEISLLGFKHSVALDPAGLLSSWDPSSGPHCRWYGVACDAVSGRVTSLNLTVSHAPPLAGTLTPVLGNLTELRHFSLRGNNFSGEIPNEISALPSLQTLDLAHNSLSGQIPAKLIGASQLESIDLSYNQLSGKINIGVPECRFLTHLRLSNNFFIGKIPPEIGICSKIKTLLLNGNILEGRIPASIGRLGELRVLDISRNSLTGRIPAEIGKCWNLAILVLTDLLESSSGSEEFNAFIGGIPQEIIWIPGLEILWAPRSNVNGRFPDYYHGSCSLRVFNLGQNYITGEIPNWLGSCANLFFLDLSSNYLQGPVPVGLGVQCMVYFNVSRNSLSGSVVGLSERVCSENLVSDGRSGGLPEEEELLSTYFGYFRQSAQKSNPFGPVLDDENVVLHDFSWNSFDGSLPSFSLWAGRNFSYGLVLNNNRFNGPVSGEFFRSCGVVSLFAANLSVNQIPGEIGAMSKCLQLKWLEAANNRLSGLIPSDIGNSQVLSHLDLRGNYLNGTIADQFGRLKNMEGLLLGRNYLSGGIPIQLGEMASLTILDLSRNSLIGTIPPSLSSVTNIEILLLDHNRLSGEIPLSFSLLTRLNMLDVSYNNLSGEIPQLQHSTDCALFKGNSFVKPCPDSNQISPSGLPFQTEIPRWGSGKNKLKTFAVAAVASASVIVFVLMVLIIVSISRRRKLVRLTSLRRKVVVTFANAPPELSYDNVVRATNNFSIQNLIGTGGFGATYKAELVPGFLVAVKRLSIGRFQGLQQFDAEIRTLGRIRHKNLVTLIGYHMGEVDTFLIYNYLSGGNLEAFIRHMPNRSVGWPVIHKIALDVAQALAYLHYSCVPRIVHRDIKPSNILLDEKLNAYLSDFGLARLLEVSETHATTDVAGTFGYVAPEYATTCRVSHKADVYSFGVVLLELMSGKRSLDPSFSEYGNGFTIVAWGRLLIQEGRSGELFSPSLWEAGPKDNLVEMLRLALACTVESLPIRPSMKQVVHTLKQLKN